MIDPEVAQLVQKISQDLELLKSKIAAAPATQATDERPWPSDLINVSAAARLARRAEDTVRSWARKNTYETGGFGVKIGPRWSISRMPFLTFLRQKNSR